MRVLITGAAGFIGSHLTECAIRAGLSVRAVANYNSRGDLGYLADLPSGVREDCEIRVFDIRDEHAVNAAVSGVDAVFHLAALIGIPYSYVAPSSYVAVNVSGTLNLLNAALRHGVRCFVHTSTSEVYGSAQYVPIDERHPLVGQSPYAASKIGADQLAISYARSFELPVLVIRPFNTFGPRQSPRAVIPALASQLLDPSIGAVRAGTLSTIRDFTYVTDTARAYLNALERPQLMDGTVINLGTGEAGTIAAVYEELQEVAGIRKPVEAAQDRVRPERSEVRELRSDNSRARELLRWSPQVSLREGLGHLVDYLRSRPGCDALAYRV
jgi:NAD dependent epimerase/dehydratase